MARSEVPPQQPAIDVGYDGSVSGWPIVPDEPVAQLPTSARAALRAALVAAGRARRTGPLGVIFDGDVCWRLELGPAPGGAGLRVARERLAPAGPRLLDAIRRGCGGLVAHGLRSPLVRAQGATTLARRAWQRGEDLAPHLARSEAALAVALDGADADAAAVRDLADVPPPVAPPAAGRATSAASSEALLRAVGAPAPGAETPRPRLGRSARPAQVVVVVPQPAPALAAPLRRLLHHLDHDWAHAGIRVLAPGRELGWRAAPVSPAAASPAATEVVGPLADPEHDLLLARRWLDAGTDRVLDALTEVVALERAGVVVALNDTDDAACATLGLTTTGVLHAPRARDDLARQVVTSATPVLVTADADPAIHDGA